MRIERRYANGSLVIKGRHLVTQRRAATLLAEEGALFCGLCGRQREGSPSDPQVTHADAQDADSTDGAA